MISAVIISNLDIFLSEGERQFLFKLLLGAQMSHLSSPFGKDAGR
jgi:hypothetical protein